MALSARIFGLSSWSILVPQALEGVAAVGFLYATVRRWFTPAAGLLAGAVLALTPISALMFRFNNPDALLVLLLTAGAYAMVRALEAASTRWLLLAFTLVGFGFLTKMLQALLVVPAFGLVYLIAAPTPLRRRLGQLIGAGVALLVSAGWWVAIVELIPASARPYIGGSQDNSLLNLIFGYNGLGRVTGNEAGSVGGGGGQGGGRWGPTGWTRMFNAEFGGQASWLLPAALILLVALLVLTWRAKRTDRTRAAAVLWGGWLLVTAAVFSLSQGIIHPYYTVALAPAIGALVGIGGAVLWRRRNEVVARIALAVAIAATAVWAAVLLGRTPSWVPWLRPLVLVLGLGAAIAVALGPILTARAGRYIVGAALVAALAGPAAYSLSTVRTAHAGALPTAGPATGRGFGPGGGGPGGPGGQGRLPRRLRGRRLRRPAPGGCRPGGGAGQAAAGAGAAQAGAGAAQAGAGQAGAGQTAGRAAASAACSTPAPLERARADPAPGQRPVHVGGRHHRRQPGVGLPAGHRRVGDAHRRLQRVRPVTDPGPVPAAGGRRPHPLLHQRWLRRRRPGWRQQRHGQPDLLVGEQQLHLDDRGRGHAVRPHRPGVGLTPAPGASGSRRRTAP